MVPTGAGAAKRRRMASGGGHNDSDMGTDAKNEPQSNMMGATSQDDMHTADDGASVVALAGNDDEGKASSLIVTGRHDDRAASPLIVWTVR